jgi:hypothetical protein
VAVDWLGAIHASRVHRAAVWLARAERITVRSHSMFDASSRLAFSVVFAVSIAAMPLGSIARASDPCTTSANAARYGCRQAAHSRLWYERAHCENLPTSTLRAQCRMDALIAYEEALDECQDQHEARLELCDELGGGRYAPEIVPSHFSSVIDNPYMPLVPGTTRSYEKLTAEGLETVDVTVTYETRLILGVTCVVVHDIVALDGEVVEDTFDWFAQDDEGNVWYFGEATAEYENGFPINNAGQREAGADHALPGIVMLGALQEGEIYRQEFYIGIAEDAAEVEATSTPVVVPFGVFPSCLQTEDFSPLEPDHEEWKYYAPGIGLVLEFDPQSGSRTELVSITYP